MDSNLNYKNLFFKNDDYLCFYDSEFNAYDYKVDYPQEIISVGLVIVDKNNERVFDYYSLVKLKAAKTVSKRCKKLTKITDKDMTKSKDFKTVFYDLSLIIRKYKIKRVYCFGIEDRKAILDTAKLYKHNNNALEFAKLLFDIKEEYKKISKGKISNQGLKFIKDVCLIEGEVKHNALFDAIDLANVTYTLYNKGFDKKKFKILMTEREEVSNYKRAKNIKANQSIIAPKEIINAKNKIIKFLNANTITNLNEGTKKAIIDDLNELLISED